MQKELTPLQRDFLLALADGQWHTRSDLGIQSQDYHITKLNELVSAGLVRVEARPYGKYRQTYRYQLVQT